MSSILVTLTSRGDSDFECSNVIFNENKLDSVDVDYCVRKNRGKFCGFRQTEPGIFHRIAVIDQQYWKVCLQTNVILNIITRKRRSAPFCNYVLKDCVCLVSHSVSLLASFSVISCLFNGIIVLTSWLVGFSPCHTSGISC